MRRPIVLLSFCLAAPALGQPAQGDLTVTVYNQNLALVQDTRQLSLPAGRSRQEFPNVSGQISAETVTLSGSDIGVIEQNFDFDLLSPSKLMEKAVGETISKVLYPNDKTENGKELRLVQQLEPSAALSC